MPNDDGAMVVSWFSAGVSSAVATKMSIKNIDKIIYTHIDDQHPDTIRFVKDCEQWFGMQVEILSADVPSVRAACLGAGGRGYINGPGGAACTKYLKRGVRQKWEYEHGAENMAYVWGMDCTESKRCDRIVESMPQFGHIFPLVEKSISKEHAHEILRASGIKRPEMYDLGYPNNNCIGCVKGGRGYWNQIRTDFPEVFWERSKMEREIGHSCINGIFLDELDPGDGRASKIILDDCGIFCQLMAI